MENDQLVGADLVVGVGAGLLCIDGSPWNCIFRPLVSDAADSASAKHNPSGSPLGFKVISCCAMRGEVIKDVVAVQLRLVASGESSFAARLLPKIKTRLEPSMECSTS